MPRVTVAVPVYNGAQLLEECLDCLHQQTYQDFRVKIIDNASTDETRTIADRFVEKDKRFTVITRPETVPALDNFQDALESADCDYFAWRAHDDLSAPTYLEHLVRLLNDNPGASLAACEVRSYNEDKDRWRIHRAPRIPNVRILDALVQMFGSHACWIYGLYRRDRLEECNRAMLEGLPGYLAATDHATMFPMLIRGEAVVTNDTYFIQRVMHRPQTQRTRNSSERWEYYKVFHRFFQEQVDKSDLDPLARAVMKLAAVSYTNRKVYSLPQIIRWKLTGR